MAKYVLLQAFGYWQNLSAHSIFYEKVIKYSERANYHCLLSEMANFGQKVVDGWLATILNFTLCTSIHVHTYYAVDLENFSVKKLCQAHTSMKLKHMRFFTMTILLLNN